MKIITISIVGYNHPSQANWSYSIYKIYLIYTSLDNSMNMSYLAKEAFMGDGQACRVLSEAIGHKVSLVKSIYTSTGTPRITGIAKVPSIENKELISDIKAFLQ